MVKIGFQNPLGDNPITGIDSKVLGGQNKKDQKQYQTPLQQDDNKQDDTQDETKDVQKNQKGEQGDAKNNKDEKNIPQTRMRDDTAQADKEIGDIDQNKQANFSKNRGLQFDNLIASTGNTDDIIDDTTNKEEEIETSKIVDGVPLEVEKKIINRINELNKDKNLGLSNDKKGEMLIKSLQMYKDQYMEHAKKEKKKQPNEPNLGAKGLSSEDENFLETMGNEMIESGEQFLAPTAAFLEGIREVGEGVAEVGASGIANIINAELPEQEKNRIQKKIDDYIENQHVGRVEEGTKIGGSTFLNPMMKLKGASILKETGLRAIEGLTDAGIYHMIDSGKLELPEAEEAVLSASLGGFLPAGGKLFESAKNKLLNKPEVDEYLQQIAKPAISKMDSEKKRKNYINKLKDGLTAVVSNTDNIKYSTQGAEEAGRLPKDLSELGEALSQTKMQVWKEIDEQLKIAKGQGLKVSSDFIANELRVLKSSDDMQAITSIDENFENYINKKIEKFEGKDWTIDQLEKLKQEFNNDLKDYWNKTQGAKKTRELNVDAFIKNNLEKKLDELTQKLGEKGYTDLNREYGAVKELETLISKRIANEGKKKPGQLIDATDIFTAGELARGLSGDPFSIAAGLAQLGGKRVFDYVNNVDTQTKNMLKSIQKEKQALKTSISEQGKKQIKNKLEQLKQQAKEKAMKGAYANVNNIKEITNIPVFGKGAAVGGGTTIGGAMNTDEAKQRHQNILEKYGDVDLK